MSKGTTRNYFNRSSKPNADYLERISISFELGNLHWLLTGQGEPLILPADENNSATVHAEKSFRSPVVGTNHGRAYQETNATPTTADVENIKTKLALVKQENKHLKEQLATKDALLTSQEETLALPRISFNRLN